MDEDRRQLIRDDLKRLRNLAEFLNIDTQGHFKDTPVGDAYKALLLEMKNALTRVSTNVERLDDSD